MKNNESLFSIIFAFFSILLLFFLSSSILIGIFVIILLFLISLPVLYPLIKPGLKLKDLSDKVFYARTEDNWYLPLHYHEPRFIRKKVLPVILCHGIAQNKYAMDLDEFHSLAVYLKVRGFPVFVVSLRGAGKSYYSHKIKKKHYITFDDHVFFDAPAIIKRVMELTNAPAVNWVGFSMGGMIGYAIAGSNLIEGKKIRTLITLGSPGKADYITNKLIQPIINHPGISKIFPIRAGSRIISPLGKFLYTPLDKILYNPKNTKKKVIQLLLANCIESINQGLIDEFTSWARNKNEISIDKMTNYRKNLEKIKIPTLLIAGSVDHIAPPSQINFAYTKISSSIKKFVIAGKQMNYKEDYGHLCLTIGDHVHEEIFPLILDWLEKYGNEKPKKVRSFIEKIKRKIKMRKILKRK